MCLADIELRSKNSTSRESYMNFGRDQDFFQRGGKIRAYSSLKLKEGTLHLTSPYRRADDSFNALMQTLKTDPLNRLLTKNMHTYSLRINGMTCGGCAASIQRKLEAIDGINHCEVNFTTELARIKSDSVIHPKQLIDWVRSFGFSVQTEEHRFTVSDKQLDQQLLTSIFDSDQNIVAYQLNPDLQTVTYTALPDADHKSLDQALLALGLLQMNEMVQTLKYVWDF